ncbi:carboxylate-amine ligase [Rhodoplanes elegans]|uniref:Putative glutamate--cysteine ligase 2 n=1 Tax=Rhodoplanes elegans TaxID=29408 RepID=A0A327JTW2_9BRAD|nr:carboxylate-amine ligase [Rhodoplanes elegans]MBK5958627.1 carboxylate-amine ligase [Rhodoplanes elegans]RAI28914.1 carboxylate-amine ligase [Rhodoplanes elegans]
MRNTRVVSSPARTSTSARTKPAGEVGGRRAFTIGLEEEFFLVGARTLAVPRRVDPAVFRRAEAVTRGRAKPEFLQAQIEIVSGVHDTLRGARAEMAELREAVADTADAHGLAVLAAGTHPGADWRRVRQTEAQRYDRVMDQLQMIGRRDLLCGLHVHVELPDPARRVEIMRRMVPYLPLLLALSTSSPFWAGLPTGLKGYRLAAYAELPRTGLPPAFRSEAEYRTYVDAMARAGAIPDASYLWWAIRPSASLPTLELRAPDCCTRLDDAIAVAALYRVLARHLYRTRPAADDMPAVTHALAQENQWRAQRSGVQASFVTRDGPEPVAAVLERLLRQAADDIDALDCAAEVAHCRTIVAEGTSADAQLAVYEQHVAGGHRAALRAVLQWLRDETIATRADPEPRTIAGPPLLPSHDPEADRDSL